MSKKIKIIGKVGFIIGILFISFFPVKVLSQYPDWINYTNGQHVRAVAVEGSEIWIGTQRGGLVMIDTLTDTTVFYNHANSGLPDNDVTTIAIDASGNKWIGTGGGLAVYSGGTGIEEENNEKVKNGNAEAMKIYPNPFISSMVIHYAVSAVGDQGAAVSVKVYDLSGKLVKTLLNKKQKTGYYSIKWDGTNNTGKKPSSGIYFIKLKAGGFKQTKRIILMK